MNTLAIAVVGLGAGFPTDAVTASLGFGPSAAEMLAGLGAFAVATLGVLVVRTLQAPSRPQDAPAACPEPRGDVFKHAA